MFSNSNLKISKVAMNNFNMFTDVVAALFGDCLPFALNNAFREARWGCGQVGKHGEWEMFLGLGSGAYRNIHSTLIFK